MSSLLPPAQWFAQLPTVYLASCGLVTDEAGNVLVVDPNYRQHWTLPGGVVEEGEAPHLACQREISEEVGLDLSVGPLLACQWSAPHGERPRPFLSFVFDCGTVAADTTITLQREELDGYAFVPPQQAVDMLHPAIAPRLRAALRARITGSTEYVA